MADEGILPKDLPYRAEYAKSARASCKSCKKGIDKDELKLAIMAQSRFHDGKDANFFHVACFFMKAKPKSVGDIAHFEQLRWDDQEMLKKKIGGGSGGGASSGSSSKKDKEMLLKDFRVEYAKSSASLCQACEEKIPKNVVRVSKKEHESERALMFSQGAGLDRWHHLDCFVKVREHLEYFNSGKDLPGYKDLDREDQAEVAKKLPMIKASKAKADTTDSKTTTSKRKQDAEGGSSSKRAKQDKPAPDKAKVQNDKMYKFRDALDGWPLNDLVQILATNKQEIPKRSAQILLDRITDIMAFGALQPCPKCETGQFVFRSGTGYQCLGHISEFTKCMNVTDSPPRVPFKVPNDFRELEPFASYKFKPDVRVLQNLVSTVKPAESAGKPKIIKSPLKGFKFLVSTSDKEKEAKWIAQIEEYGGSIASKCSSKLAAVITEKDSQSKTVKYAEKNKIPLVKGEFAETLTDVNYNLTSELNKNLICDWVKDVSPWLRGLNQTYEEGGEKKRSQTDYYKKEETSVRLKMKDGAVVDPDSELEDVGHVLKDGKRGFYNCVLNKTSIEEGKNSYYKQQIIEADRGNMYWVFQAWGRIGTTIGGNKTHEDLSKGEAIDVFCKKFEEQTGNRWGSPFQMKPGRYRMLEVDYGEKDHLTTLVPNSSESTLPMPVQELVSLIFDVGRMQQAMMEFELNLEEMPLGKISRTQILNAYTALTDLSNAIPKVETGHQDQDIHRSMRDATNRFYTLIPHNFGSMQPPPLNSEDIIKSKIEMLDSLMEIELAYELLLEGDKKGGDSSIDAHYKTLNAAIDPLETGSEEFAMIDKYLKNTHAATHDQYTLDIEQVFKVNRKVEDRQFRPFQKLHNRRLLWHGSRTTNYAGILAQGLRIAPKEAPATGYMFGKGIYFADMVSKSANYCYTSRDNAFGLMLLCEVALGDIHELKRAKETLAKAPDGRHSVQGCGKTQPDPKGTITLPDGVQVPTGKAINVDVKGGDLLYNEFIVYDVAQVHIRYLLKVNFNYAPRRRH